MVVENRNRNIVPLHRQFERENCAPTRENLRAHGGGGFSHRNATRERVNFQFSIINFQFKNYGTESKSKGTVAEHRQVCW